jgi:hypothetical protein
MLSEAPCRRPFVHTVSHRHHASPLFLTCRQCRASSHTPYRRVQVPRSHCALGELMKQSPLSFLHQSVVESLPRRRQSPLSVSHCANLSPVPHRWWCKTPFCCSGTSLTLSQWCRTSWRATCPSPPVTVVAPSRVIDKHHPVPSLWSFATSGFPKPCQLAQLCPGRSPLWSRP